MYEVSSTSRTRACVRAIESRVGTVQLEQLAGAGGDDGRTARPPGQAGDLAEEVAFGQRGHLEVAAVGVADEDLHVARGQGEEALPRLALGDDDVAGLVGVKAQAADDGEQLLVGEVLEQAGRDHAPREVEHAGTIHLDRGGGRGRAMEDVFDDVEQVVAEGLLRQGLVEDRLGRAVAVSGSGTAAATSGAGSPMTTRPRVRRRRLGRGCGRRIYRRPGLSAPVPSAGVPSEAARPGARVPAPHHATGVPSGRAAPTGAAPSSAPGREARNRQSARRILPPTPAWPASGAAVESVAVGSLTPESPAAGGGASGSAVTTGRGSTGANPGSPDDARPMP